EEMASVETKSRWHEAAEAVSWDIRPFIDGEYRESKSTDAFENVNPADESVLCEFGVGSSADLDDAVGVARKRFEEGCWSELPGARRPQILMKLADLIGEHAEEIALLDAVEMGKPIQQALFDAGTFCAAMLRTPASFADKLFGQTAQM